MLQSITVPTAGQLAEDRALGLGVVSGITSWGQWDSLGPVPGDRERMMHGACLGDVSTLNQLDSQRTSGSPCWAGAETRAAFCPIFTSRIPESPQQDASPARHSVPPAAGCAGDQCWVALLSPPSSAAIPHTTHRHSHLHCLAPHTAPPPLTPTAPWSCPRPKPLHLLLLRVGKVKENINDY